METSQSDELPDVSELAEIELSDLMAASFRPASSQLKDGDKLYAKRALGCTLRTSFEKCSASDRMGFFVSIQMRSA